MSDSRGELDWDALQKLAAEGASAEADDVDEIVEDEVDYIDDPEDVQDSAAKAAPAEKKKLPPRSESPARESPPDNEEGAVTGKLRSAMRQSRVRPGSEDTLRSPLVLGLGGGTAALVLIGFIFHFMINRQTTEEAYDAAKQLYDDGKYANAVTALTEFLALNGQTEFAKPAMLYRGMAEVDKSIITAKDYPAGLEKLRGFVSEFQDYDNFDTHRPYVADRARLVALEAAKEAGRKKEDELLKTSDEARTVFTTYAAQDIKPKELIAEIEKTKRASQAEILRDRTQATATVEIDKALVKQDTLGGIASWRNLVGRYDELRNDAKIAALLTKVLAAEQKRVVVEPQSVAGVTTERESQVPTPTTFAFHARSSTDEVSGGRCVLAVSKDCCYGVDTITGEPVWRRTVGVNAPFFPVLDSSTGSAFMFDTVHNELLKIEINTGKLLWRSAIETPAVAAPLLAGGRLLLPTTGGKLYDISSADGAISRRVVFSQSVGTPASMPGNERIVVAGDQEVFYVLNVSSLECERVQYLGDGHPSGSIAAPLLPMGPYILACENRADGASSDLHILNAAQTSGELVEVASTTVQGLVVDPPVIRGQDLFVPSTGERVSSFTVSDVAGQPILTVGPVYPGQALSQAPISLLAGPERQVWLAGSAVRKLQVIGDDLQSSPNPAAVGTVSQPLQYVDRRLFHGRRRAYTDAVTFVRMDRETLEGDTQAVLGAKILAWSISDRTPPSVMVATEAGMVFRTTAAKWDQGGLQTTDAERLPLNEDLNEPIGAVAMDKGQLAVAAGGPEPKLWVLNAVGKLDRSFPLTSGPTAPLGFLSGRVMVPMQGRIKLVTTGSGQGIVEDFTLPTEEMPNAKWRYVTTSGETDVIAVLDSGDVILARYQSTPRQFLGQVARISLGAPVHVEGDAEDGLVVLADGARKVHLLEASSLTTRGERELASPIATKAYLAGDLVFVETADHTLHALKQDESLSDAWSLPHASLAGRPSPMDKGLLLPLVDGRVLTVNPQSGAVVTTVETGQGLAGSPFAVGNERLLPTRDGSLVRLSGGQP
ncbi:MAG: PQQ-binding-like beta-propeller repeat protein [Planctomycetaceae bacterium]